MKIIICGAGEVGFSLAKYLATENMRVTVIDERSDKLHKVSGSIDVRSIVGKIYNPKNVSEIVYKLVEYEPTNHDENHSNYNYSQPQAVQCAQQ